ncbi:MAG: 16S rRNA (guanine(966)-N(2))-methyltransferase RsmD [Oscillospiraceae bacterium]
MRPKGKDNMKVITGSARGKNLATLIGGDIVRPTSQRVKEGMFSAVQFHIAGARVLDMFAGCGQLGIEALSRGAALAVFVDESRDAAAVVTQNLKNAELYSSARVISTESLRFAKFCKEKFDIVFIDPPYRSELALPSLELVAPIVSDGGFVFVEADRRTEFPDVVGALSLHKRYKYGNVSVWLYRAENYESDGDTE